MDLVKKNILSILCGVAALICVVMVFYPFGPMFGTLVTGVKASEKIGDQISQVRSAQRFWPTLSSREDDRVELASFPTPATLEIGKRQTDSWIAQTGEFLQQAIKLQTDALKELIPGALPGNAGQQELAFNFQDAYRIIFGQKIDPRTRAKTDLERAIFNTEIIGALPPSDVEVKLEQERIINTIKTDRPRVINGVVTNQEEIDQEIAEKTGIVLDQMRQQRASAIQVYLDPVTVFKPSPRIATTQAPSPNDIFDAQVGLWIQQEICRGIRHANKGAKQGVLDAPVKRLLDLTFTLPYAAVPGVPTPEPLVLPSNPASKITPDFSRNPLGHVSNEVYDVIPFKISLICEAQTLPQTLTDLTSNRYMMYRRVETLSVDSAVALQQGFLYGNKPVVQVNIDGQYLLLRKFIAPLMPQDVIRSIVQPGGAVPVG